MIPLGNAFALVARSAKLFNAVVLKSERGKAKVKAETI